MAQKLRIVVDPKEKPLPRLVDVKDEEGRSVNAGEWRERADGLLELVIRRGLWPTHK
jgi:hypothetical protein